MSVVPGPATPGTWLLFVAVICIGVFNAGSYAYFVLASRNFIEVQQQRGAPRYTLGKEVSWLGTTPGALSGWWPPLEKEGTWSVGPHSALEVILPERPVADLQLEMLAGAFVAPGASAREVGVLANGTEVARWQVKAAPHTYTARIPARLVSGERLRLEFRPSDVPSPADLGQSADYRRLGLLVVSWKLVAASP